MKDNVDFLEFVHQTSEWLTNPAVWLAFSWIVLKVLIYFVAGRLVVQFAGRAITHMIERKSAGRGPVQLDPRRTQTIGRLVKNVISYAVNFIVIMLVLSEFGVDLAPLLAGAGVMGLAIGFGAQSLVKDVITGFFIIFEDQFAVGDVVKTGNFQGTVQEIGLRVTRIKSWTGEVHIIPNGAILEVTNFSTNNSIGVVDVSVAYDSDIEKVTEIIRRTAHEVFEGNENMIKEPEVLGVQTIGAAEIVLRVTFECKPLQHHAVGRQMNAAIKKALAEEGIEAPFPRLVTFQRSV